MCQMKNQNKAKKLGKQQWCLYLPPVNRLVEIPWIENNVINSVITRDQWIEHHSWPSRNDWNPSWLRHSGISIISWRSLVVFNFHWSLVMTELMLHCYIFPKFLLVSWWRFKTFWITIDDVNIFWHRQWIPDLIWRVFRHLFWFFIWHNTISRFFFTF